MVNKNICHATTYSLKYFVLLLLLGVTHAIKLHHDNARPHVHKDVLNYLKSKGIQTIRQLPNSPDLAPCDFWLFDRIKQDLTDESDSKSLHRAVTKIMNSINREDYNKTFDKWIERMQLRVNNQGNYFRTFDEIKSFLKCFCVFLLQNLVTFGIP
jgi:hypothetical protein